MLREALIVSCLVMGCTAKPALPVTLPVERPTRGAATKPAPAASRAAPTPTPPPEPVITHVVPSVVPSQGWAATIPEPWPPGAEPLDRPIEYDPSSGILSIGREQTGRPKKLSAEPLEWVRVIWVPRFVPPQQCEDQAPPQARALAIPREFLDPHVRDAETSPEGAEAPTEPLVFAEVDVPTTCAELADPRWLAMRTAQWSPSLTEKRQFRAVPGGRVGDGGIAAVLQDREQLHGYIGDLVDGIDTIDFGLYAVVVLGEGMPRLHFVATEATERQQVWAVDIPIVTTTCKGRRPRELANVVYLADDTGPEPGLYRVEGAPLLLRPAASLEHEEQVKSCSKVFPHWALRLQPDTATMKLSLYGTPDEDDPGLSGRSELRGDTLHVYLQTLAEIPCLEGAEASEDRLEVLLDQRKAAMSRPWVVPLHDGPVKLVADTPYDAITWDEDAEACEDREQEPVDDDGTEESPS